MIRVRVVCIALALALPGMAVHAQALPKPQPAAPAKPGAPAPAAAPAAPAKPSPFDEMDTNHDGFVSREEFLAAQKKRFDEFDTNHDGKIDAKEIASSPPLMARNLTIAERMVKQWDSNGDGVVTADEFKKFSDDRFTKQDKAGTGKIPRPTPPAGMQPGMMHPQNSQQPIHLNVKPAPEPKPSDSSPQH